MGINIWVKIFLKLWLIRNNFSYPKLRSIKMFPRFGHNDCRKNRKSSELNYINMWMNFIFIKFLGYWEISVRCNKLFYSNLSRRKNDFMYLKNCENKLTFNN